MAEGVAGGWANGLNEPEIIVSINRVLSNPTNVATVAITLSRSLTRSPAQRPVPATIFDALTVARN